LTGITSGRITGCMTVTVKGQITIPQALRERFGLQPGTEVEFVVGENALQVKPRKRSRRAATPFDAWLNKAAGSATTKLSTDQVMAATRGEG
jgi:AbrB family looped-hinge helix DNA binding protein